MDEFQVADNRSFHTMGQWSKKWQMFNTVQV